MNAGFVLNAFNAYSEQVGENLQWLPISGDTPFLYNRMHITSTLAINLSMVWKMNDTGGNFKR